MYNPIYIYPHPYSLLPYLILAHMLIYTILYTHTYTLTCDKHTSYIHLFTPYIPYTPYPQIRYAMAVYNKAASGASSIVASVLNTIQIQVLYMYVYMCIVWVLQHMYMSYVYNM